MIIDDIFFPFKAPFLGDITFPRFVNRRLYAIVFQAPALPKVSLLRRPDPVMRWKNRWFLWCLNEWWLIDGSLMVHWWLMKLIYPYGISMVNDGWMGIYQWGFYDAELLLNYVEFQLNVTSQISNFASEFDLFKGNGKVIPYVSSLSIFAIQSLFVGVIRVIPISCTSIWISEPPGSWISFTVVWSCWKWVVVWSEPWGATTYRWRDS